MRYELEKQEYLLPLDISDWEKEWIDMPKFYPPTRNTTLRNSYDISDMISWSKFKTKKFPKYPIYIISKGRFKKRITVNSLEKLNLEYKIVVEPQEYDQYTKYISKNKIISLPFSNLGQGSIPARNFVFEHSIKLGVKRHWILDDNIAGFGVQKYGRRVNVLCGDIFNICEGFVDRYENIALAGMRYRFHHNYVKAPYLLNTRIYSCILINNSIPFRWRGKYNEDTDISLRVLKAGYCTLLFTWCYCNKMKTMSLSGGNTEELYSNNGRTKMAESLKSQHYELVKITKKWGRVQHQVNYKVFKNNKLKKIDTINN